MRWLVIVLLFAMSACTSWREVPDDLTLVGIHEAEGLYGKTPKWEFIDVELKTKTNYNNYVNKNWSYSSAVAYFCDQDNIDVQMLGGFGLYKKDDNITSVGYGVHDKSSPPYYYHTGINTHNHDETPTNPHRQAILEYDLREQPRDVCLYLAAGAMLSHQKSNVVRIPKEEFIKFFAEHPRPQVKQ